MSTDNVTPFPPKGPPAKPKKQKRPPVAFEFAEGNGDSEIRTLRVYQGLRGVCNALDTVDQCRDLSLYGDLSAAAAVLIALLDERWL